MELGSFFLFRQEQIKDTIIIIVASYIYIMFLTAPPTPFSSRLNFYVPIFSLYVLPPYALSIWRAITDLFFLRTINLHLSATSCHKNGAIDL
jgi:hypothetical protein